MPLVVDSRMTPSPISSTSSSRRMSPGSTNVFVIRTNGRLRKSARRVFPVALRCSAAAVSRSWSAPTNVPWSTSTVRAARCPSSSKKTEPQPEG